MQELLISKNKDQAFMLEDLVKWKAKIEESLKLTLGSWKGMQVCQVNNKLSSLIQSLVRLKKNIKKLINLCYVLSCALNYVCYRMGRIC